MKKSNLFLNMMLGAALIFGVSSCEEDTVVPPSAGIAVADGFYFTQVGVDPVAAAQLKSAMVDAPSFGAMAREGFVQGYAYLTAGSYNLVEVKDKAIISTLGGASGTVPDADVVNSECDASGYGLVSATVDDGAAFSIATDGLYVIAYDATLGSIIYDEITSVGIIGDGTEGGWSTDTELTDATLSAEGGTWGATDVLLKPGVMKFRFNCRWAIDRRIDTGQDFDNANGFSMFTNFGGTIDKLLPGNEGPNIETTERALFTVTFSWDPITGVAATMTRTGDAPPIVFDPAEWAWGIIGDATAQQWDADMNMYYGGENAGTHTWYTSIALLDAGSFKFRTNDSWDTNLGGTLAPGAASALTLGGPDMATPGIGSYYIALQTSDDGATWTATMTQPGWTIIGDGGPLGSWDLDALMMQDLDIVTGVETYTLTGDFTAAGAWKYRAGNAWDYSLGDDGAGGITAANGANFTVPADGNYTVVLTYDGTMYSHTVTLN